jgi:hypothetical protein
LKIYEALAEVKTLKTRLIQLSKFRESTLVYDVDSEPDFRYEELTRQIEETLERETELKLAIQAANLSTVVSVGDKEMPLAKAILELGNTRSKLAQVAGMLGIEKRTDLLGRRYRSKDEVLQKWQKSPADLVKIQTELENRRNSLDSIIQEANHRVSISLGKPV